MLIIKLPRIQSDWLSRWTCNFYIFDFAATVLMQHETRYWRRSENSQSPQIIFYLTKPPQYYYSYESTTDNCLVPKT